MLASNVLRLKSLMEEHIHLQTYMFEYLRSEFGMENILLHSLPKYLSENILDGCDYELILKVLVFKDYIERFILGDVDDIGDEFAGRKLEEFNNLYKQLMLKNNSNDYYYKKAEDWIVKSNDLIDEMKEKD